MNGMIEADIYGNVNSTHVMGSRIQKDRRIRRLRPQRLHRDLRQPVHGQSREISAIVPMASHVDHKHDLHVLITEHGVAHLRALPPDNARSRSSAIVRTPTTATPSRTTSIAPWQTPGKHTPHLLDEALDGAPATSTTEPCNPELNDGRGLVVRDKWRPAGSPDADARWPPIRSSGARTPESAAVCKDQARDPRDPELGPCPLATART